jgi:hypothetical protein
MERKKLSGAIMPTPTMPTPTIPTQFLPANNANGSNPDFNIEFNIYRNFEIVFVGINIGIVVVGIVGNFFVGIIIF